MEFEDRKRKADTRANLYDYEWLTFEYYADFFDERSHTGYARRVLRPPLYGIYNTVPLQAEFVRLHNRGVQFSSRDAANDNERVIGRANSDGLVFETRFHLPTSEHFVSDVGI